MESLYGFMWNGSLPIYIVLRVETPSFNEQRIKNHHNNRISVQPGLTVFFAYFRPDLL